MPHAHASLGIPRVVFCISWETAPGKCQKAHLALIHRVWVKLEGPKYFLNLHSRVECIHLIKIEFFYQTHVILCSFNRIMKYVLKVMNNLH